MVHVLIYVFAVGVLFFAFVGYCCCVVSGRAARDEEELWKVRAQTQHKR